MAKRRNSAALFEVFHDTRGPASTVSPVASVLSGFRSWFKTRIERSAVADADPNDPTTLPIKSPLLNPRPAPVDTAADTATDTIVEPAPIKPAPKPQQPRPQTQAQSAVMRLDAASETIHRQTSTQPRPAVERPRGTAAPSASLAVSSPVNSDADDSTSNARRHSHVRFDRDRREVTLHLRLNTAVVTCFGILLTVALAYALGRRTATRQATSLAPAVQTDLNGIEVQPRALDLPRHAPHLSAGTGTPIVKPPRAALVHESTPVANVPHHVTVTDPPAPPADDNSRTIGLNYHIIYGSSTEADAAEVRDCFVKSGIPCTVETKLVPSGVCLHPFTVVTRQGFERTGVPECKQLEKQVQKAENQFPANLRNKKFYWSPFKLKEQ